MDGEEFVAKIKEYVRDTAIEDVVNRLIKPPGRKPRRRHIQLSNWFNQLSDDDRQMVKGIVTEAVDEAIFGVLSTLDGARPIEDSIDKGSFNLIYTKEGEQILLNPPDNEYLHDIYNSITNS